MLGKDVAKTLRSRLSQSVQRLWLVCLCISPLAQATDIPLVLTDNSGIYQQFARLISQRTALPTETLLLNQATHEIRQRPIVVAIGTRACEELARHTQSPTRLICTFLPSQAFQHLIDHPQKADTDIERAIDAVFLDQPIQRQVALARLLVPQAKYLGTLYGESSQIYQTEIEEYAQQYGFLTLSDFLREEGNPVQTLTPLLERSQVFLALPDSTLFNRTVTKWLLYISLRNRVPLIGFSESYVDAGALIGVYSTPEQQAQQVAETLSAIRQGRSPVQAFPQYFTLKVNSNTERTLRMRLPSLDQLSQALLQEEMR